MKYLLDPEWTALLTILSNGRWRTLKDLPPSLVINRVVEGCIGQGLLGTKDILVPRHPKPGEAQSFLISIRITARGKKALATGTY